MTRGTSVRALVCTAGFLGLQQHAITSVQGHAYLMAPISRQFWCTDAFLDSGCNIMEYCPHCLQSRGPAAVRARAEEFTDPVELAKYGGGRWPHFDAYERGEVAANGNYLETDAISVRHGLCGDPGQTEQEGTNLYAQENSMYPVLESFAEGSILETKVVMSTYHWGHLEFFICNAEDLEEGPDGPVTQGCFNMHPLDRAADDGNASPIDLNHSGRYYVDPPCRAEETDQTKLPRALSGTVVTARYQLPEGLTCERCILQMVYYTGNSCHHPGYEDFNPPSWPSECASLKSDWINLNPGLCGVGLSYPEEFWNCADIKIGEGSAGPGPTPTPSPFESEPVDESTSPSPTAEPEVTRGPTPAPVAEPEVTRVPTPVGTTMSVDRTPAQTDESSTISVVSDEESTQGESVSGSTPTPVVSVPPATFAPVAVDEEEACNGQDVVEDYGQCGGQGYEGSSCCGQGFVCEKMAECYSECRPLTECAESWGQCGGTEWEGPTCCGEGAECVKRSEWYSHCTPAEN